MPKSPSDSVRSFWFCAAICAATRTFCAEVAKWLCHNKVSFSWNGWRTTTMRRIHQSDSTLCCSVSCWLYCLRAAGVARLPGGWGAGRAGIGVASAPGSASGSAASIASRWPGQPRATAASTSGPVTPKPARRSMRAVPTHRVDCPAME
ncbi:hypothetical protein MAHJHV33_13020 [Mycobacterium avium subsp. hominissuis]